MACATRVSPCCRVGSSISTWIAIVSGALTNPGTSPTQVDNMSLPASSQAFIRFAPRCSRDGSGVFDEGCMGMFNAIVPDHLLHRTGVFKERLSQSALYHESTRVKDTEARA